MELLIQYIYSGQICIDSDNVFDILAASQLLELDEVKEFCFEFLESCITPVNCISILITAKQYKNFTLRDTVYKHISENYQAVTNTAAFMALKSEELFFIVFHLKTRFSVNDEVLCQSLLSWTKQDKETRRQHLQSRLFKFVNVDQLSYCLVKDLLNEKLICCISEYFVLLNTRMKRLKYSGTKILSIGGYFTRGNIKTVFTLDDLIDVNYPDLPTPLDYHRTVKVNNFLYCIGGKKTGSSQSNKVFKLVLNRTNTKWTEMAAMKKKRRSHGAAVFNDTLVVCGGYDDKNHLSLSEAYDTKLNKWNLIPSLKQSRYRNQLTSSGGCLYTMGGYDGKNCLSSVERLDGLDQSWKSVSSMQTPRSWFAAVSCDDVVYAIGGTSDGLNTLKSVEMYLFAADTWIFVSEMNIERRLFSACVMQGKIFAIGGLNGKDKPVKEIECYDPLSDKWEIVARIEDELIDHSLVVI